MSRVRRAPRHRGVKGVPLLSQQAEVGRARGHSRGRLVHPPRIGAEGGELGLRGLHLARGTRRRVPICPSVHNPLPCALVPHTLAHRGERTSQVRTPTKPQTTSENCFRGRISVTISGRNALLLPIQNDTMPHIWGLMKLSGTCLLFAGRLWASPDRYAEAFALTAHSIVLHHGCMLIQLVR